MTCAFTLHIDGRPVGKETRDEMAARFWSKVDVRGPDDCWNWKAGTFDGGYGQFKIAGTPKVATRVVIELATGIVLADPSVFVCHRCDNPPCVNPAHLFLSDAAGNNADMLAKGRGRSPRPGEGSARKLTWELVHEIRRRHAAGGVSQRALAAEYGVGPMTISRAVRGETWRTA